METRFGVKLRRDGKYAVDYQGSAVLKMVTIFAISASIASAQFPRLFGPSQSLPNTGQQHGNLWIADPPADSVYSVTTGGVLLETVSFSSQPNPYAHPQLLVQAPSGILFGTTGEPNPAFNDTGSVFSINAGLPPPQ